MKRASKYFIAGITFLIFSLAITFNILLNPNNYKKEIVSYVSQSIDYNFSYEGKISLSYLPNIFFSVPNIKITSKEESNRNLIAKAKEIKMSVLFMPLIKGIIDVQNVQAIKGEIFGFNIDNTLLNTYAIAKRTRYVTRIKNSTKFQQLDATGKIVGEILTIIKANIETDLLTGTGTGTINLNNKTGTLKFIAKIKNDETTMSRYGDAYPFDLIDKELPINIQGNLESPSVSIDLSSIIKHEIEELKDKAIEELKEKIEEKIKIKLPF